MTTKLKKENHEHKGRNWNNTIPNNLKIQNYKKKKNYTLKKKKKKKKNKTKN